MTRTGMRSGRKSRKCGDHPPRRPLCADHVVDRVSEDAVGGRRRGVGRLETLTCAARLDRAARRSRSRMRCASSIRLSSATGRANCLLRWMAAGPPTSTAPATGTDAVSAMGFLARTNQCDAASITTIAGSKRRGGSITFEMYGPQPTEWLNHVRAIQVAEDDGRWRFFEAGQPQPFEDLDAYRTRRIRDRLTTDMLSRYCEALGFRPFEVSAYREAVLVRSNRPDDIVLISLEDVQRRLELTPSPPAMLNRPDVPGGRALRWTRAASRWLRGSRANPDR